jgi:hypothetical protein
MCSPVRYDITDPTVTETYAGWNAKVFGKDLRLCNIITEAGNARIGNSTNAKKGGIKKSWSKNRTLIDDLRLRLLRRKMVSVEKYFQGNHFS